MLLPRRLGIALLVASLLPMGATAQAAELDAYLPEDTDGLLTVNVKQVLGSPAYTKHFQQQIEGLLQQDPVQAILKGTGIDPLQDVERITLVVAPSCYGREGEFKQEPAEPMGGPLFIVQGNLDAAKLKSFLERMGQKAPVKVTELKAGHASLWEVKATKADMTYYLAIPEKGTVIVAVMKAQVVTTLERATAGKKAELKSEALRQWLGRFDRQASVAWAAISSMITGTSRSATFRKVGSKEAVPVTVNHARLIDIGITAVTGSVDLAEDLRAQTTLTFKDAETAQAMAKTTKASLEQGISFLSKAVEKEKAFEPLIDALNGVKVTPKEKMMALEVQAKPAAVQGIIGLLSLMQR